MKHWIAIVLLLSCCAQASSKSLRGGPVLPNSFTYTITDFPRVVSLGGTSTSVVNGVTTVTVTGATVKDDKKIQANFMNNLVSGAVGWVSSNTSVATVDSFGFVTHVSDGTTVVTGSTPYYQLPVSLSFVTQSGTTITTSTTTTTGSGTTVYTSPSLAYSIDTAFDALLTGSGSEPVCRFFTSSPTSGAGIPTTDGTAVYYTRNSSLWSGTSFDLSGISIWNSTSTWSETGDGMDMLGGTLITPQHVISCNHYHWNTGDTLIFVTGSGTVIHRTLTGVSQVGSTDAFLGRLNAPVPSGLPVYSVLPTNFLQYFPTHAIPNGLTALVVAQNPSITDTNPPHGHLKNLWVMRLTVSGSNSYNLATDCASTTRSLFGLPRGYAVSGDSGEPTFLKIDGELVLVGCYYVTSGSPNSAIIGIHDQINAILSGTGALSTGTTYQLTDHNMSNWTTQ